MNPFALSASGRFAVAAALCCAVSAPPILAAQVGPAFTVAANGQFVTVARAANGNFVVGWQDPGAVYPIYAGAAFLQPYTANGTALVSDPITVSDAALRSPTLAMDAAGNFVATWLDDRNAPSSAGIVLGTLYAQRYAASGSARGRKLRIASANQFNVAVPPIGNGYSTELPKVAMNDAGDFVVGWSSHDELARLSSGTDLYESATLYAASYRADGGIIRRRTVLSRMADIAAGGLDPLPYVHTVGLQSDGNVALVLHYGAPDITDLTLQSYSQPLAANGDAVPLSDPQAVGNVGDFAAGVDAAGDVLAVTEILAGTAPNQVPACRIDRFDVAGQLLASTAPLTVGFNLSCDSVALAVAPSGDFAAVWPDQSYQDAQNNSVSDVVGQFFHADGSGDGAQFTVAQAVPASISIVAAASDAQGNLAVIWNPQVSGISGPVYGSLVQR